MRWLLPCLVLGAIACRAHRERSARAEHASPPAPAIAPGACTGDDVMTSAGCVRGELAGKLAVFRGIPYAAPPVGPLRWKLPQPPVRWTGVRDARAFGKACPQQDSPISGKLDWDEDCLTLNVWTPGRTGKRPVMVWIHGGGLTQGASSLPYYDGTHLVERGDLVVVSINYRLGPLGFLAHPALTGEDATHHASGNFGLFDQIAALWWVKANIAAFGGDPAQVTIFGESAGGESVCALMASPPARGLFARAIIESAQCVDYGKPLRALHDARGKAESAEDQGMRFAAALGCTGAGALACLRSKTAAEILGAAPAAVGFLGKGEHWGFTVEGWALPDAPASLMAAGKLADVPTIVGTNADEATLFTAKLPIARPIGFFAALRRIFPGHEAEVAAQYPLGSYGSPKQAFDALVTDVVFTCPARRAARALRRQQPHVYRYLFTHVTEQNRAKGAGATHGAEIPFVFGTCSATSKDELALADHMTEYWARFARTGDPNGGSGPAWPAYDAASDSYLELEWPITAHTGLRTAACDVLDSLAAPAADPSEP
jgi:para-nitrobenzyl esterase